MYFRKPLPAEEPAPSVEAAESAGIDRWLRLHGGLVRLGIVAAGLAIRVASSRGFTWQQTKQLTSSWSTCR